MQNGAALVVPYKSSGGHHTRVSMDTLMEPEHDISDPPWGVWGRDFTLAVVALGGIVLMQWLNTLQVENGESMRRLVTQRTPGTPFFTVCNHTSTLDDPFLLASLLPWSFFRTESDHHGTRWSLCARELCYKYSFLSAIFQNGKTLPIDRGLGVHQPAMKLVARKAAQGDWVHVFPEARISYSGRLQPLRRGVGKLICDSLAHDPSRPPIVLPFYHSGMGCVMPRGSLVPRVRNTVHVTVGHPVGLGDLLPRCNCERYDQEQVWTDIAQRISEALTALEHASPPNWDQTARDSIKDQ